MAQSSHLPTASLSIPHFINHFLFAGYINKMLLKFFRYAWSNDTETMAHKKIIRQYRGLCVCESAGEGKNGCVILQ